MSQEEKINKIKTEEATTRVQEVTDHPRDTIMMSQEVRDQLKVTVVTDHTEVEAEEAEDFPKMTMI